MEPRKAKAMALLVGVRERDPAPLADVLAARDSIVVSLCDTPAQALAALTPEVRLAAVSLDLPEGDAAELIRELRRRSPELEVVALAGTAPLRPLANFIAHSLRNPESPPGAGSPPISAREAEVLRLLTRGETYDAIGELLGITLGTVQSHIKAIYRKLEVRNKAEAAAKAIRVGLL
jgi:DNA-binding NarL/FixJ family response regulator